MIFKFLNLNSSFGAVFANTDYNASQPSFNEGERIFDREGPVMKPTKFQKLKQFGSNNQTIIGNVAGGVFVTGGLSAVGVGVSNIYGELSKAHVKTFSPETSAFHLFFNNHSSVISVPGSLSHFQDPTFVSLVKDPKFTALFDALAQNKPAGIGNLLKDYNFHNLLQVDGFKELLGNQASLTTLLNNAEVFTETNIPLINTLMGNEGLKTLFGNQEFVGLLQDQQFVALLNPTALNQYYSGQTILAETGSGLGGSIQMNQAYIDVLNNETLKPIFQNKEIQNLLANPEMIELMKNPGFAALYNDPALVNLLTNPNLQTVMMNPEFVALLGNSEVVNMLNNPEIMNMVSSPEFLNMINKTGFFEMIKNQEAILAALNDPALQNYINAANQVGVTPEQIAGAVSLMVGGIALALIGAKLIGTGKSKELEKKIKNLEDTVQDIAGAVNEAKTQAQGAQTAAGEAKTQAQGAQTAAGEAKTAAQGAQTAVNTALGTINSGLIIINKDFQTFANVSLRQNVFDKLNDNIKASFEATNDPKKNVKNLVSAIVNEIYNKLGLNTQEDKTQEEIQVQKNNLVNEISGYIDNRIAINRNSEFGLDNNLGLGGSITNKLNAALERTLDPQPARPAEGRPAEGETQETQAVTGKNNAKTKFTVKDIREAIEKEQTPPAPGGGTT